MTQSRLVMVVGESVLGMIRDSGIVGQPYRFSSKGVLVEQKVYITAKTMLWLIELCSHRDYRGFKHTGSFHARVRGKEGISF
jgi:hypothetical protein